MPTTLRPSSVMLMGEIGTGKTYAGRTFLNSGIDVFYIFIDPGMESVADVSCSDGLHWMYLPPATPGWERLLDGARRVNTLSFEGLAKLGDINKRDYNQYEKFLLACSHYVCDRCGEDFGPIDSWGTNRACIVDGLSGLNIMSMDLVVGAKPNPSQGQWGIAMSNLERWSLVFSTTLNCWAVLIAHLEREFDEVSGSVRLMCGALGRKLAPKLPRTYGEVIQAIKEGQEFSWRTEAANVALKERLLPLAGKLEPSFQLLVDEWKKRGGEIPSSK